MLEIFKKLFKRALNSSLGFYIDRPWKFVRDAVLMNNEKYLRLKIYIARNFEN